MPELAAALQAIVDIWVDENGPPRVILLVEKGHVALDEPISLYLPEETVAQLLILDGDCYGAEITVRRLLNHTSGLGDFSSGEGADGNGLPDFKDLVLSERGTVWDETMVLNWAMASAPPVTRPGETFNYSDKNISNWV